MIHSYSRAEIETMPLLLRTMHEDRKRVFIDTLGWELRSDGQQERDQFDSAPAVYLAGVDVQGSHRVSVRLLDSERPHILGSLFAELCEGPVPRGPGIREITRYIASPRQKASERLIARNMMARALVEYGAQNGITTYTAVCDMAFLSQILAAGWRCDPLGLPRRINGAVIGAFCIHVEPDTIDKMTRTWRYRVPALSTAQLEAAA